MKTIAYSNHLFTDNTEAARLLKEGKTEELAKHLKTVSDAAKKLQGNPLAEIMKCRLKIIANVSEEKGIVINDEQLISRIAESDELMQKLSTVADGTITSFDFYNYINKLN